MAGGSLSSNRLGASESPAPAATSAALLAAAMSGITYSIEYAKSGQATCKGSKEKIPKGEVRIAKITMMDRGDGSEPIAMTAWHLPVPFFQMMSRMRKSSKLVESSADLPGFDDLRHEDQERVLKMISDYHDPDVDWPPKKPKAAPKRKAEDEAEAGGGEKAPTPKKAKKPSLPEVPEETREGVSMADLRGLAEELVARCRVRGLNVPTEENAARQQLGPICKDLRTPEGTVDIKAALVAAEKLWGAVKSVDCDVEANGKLAAAFAELADFEFKKGERMKGAAFKKVVKALSEVGEEITSGKQAMKLPGVGKSSGAKIDEFLATGVIAKLEEYKNDV